MMNTGEKDQGYRNGVFRVEVRVSWGKSGSVRSNLA